MDPAAFCKVTLNGIPLPVLAADFDFEPIRVQVKAPPPVAFEWSGTFQLKRSAWELPPLPPATARTAPPTSTRASPT